MLRRGPEHEGAVLPGTAIARRPVLNLYRVRTSAKGGRDVLPTGIRVEPTAHRLNAPIRACSATATAVADIAAIDVHCVKTCERRIDCDARRILNKYFARSGKRECDRIGGSQVHVGRAARGLLRDYLAGAEDDGVGCCCWNLGSLTK